MKRKILLSTLALLLAISLVAIGCAKPAPAPAPAPAPPPAPELAAFITLYEGTGSAEVAGEIAKYIKEQLGVEVKFEALSHGVIHSTTTYPDRFTCDHT